MLLGLLQDNRLKLLIVLLFLLNRTHLSLLGGLRRRAARAMPGRAHIRLLLCHRGQRCLDVLDAGVATTGKLRQVRDAAPWLTRRRCGVCG